MKYAKSDALTVGGQVAPLVGAWIEIAILGLSGAPASVAPLVGAWIEILSKIPKSANDIVAPLVGAWIEIFVFI